VRTGILGGTFDPIHIAHLHAGETALHQAKLDRVVFIPAGRPWQKEGSAVSSSDHRLAMTRLGVAGVGGFEVDAVEVGRDGPTYTVDTLKGFPDDEELFLILGADAANGMRSWERYSEVLERVTVLVVPRPGTDSTDVLAAIPGAVFLDMAVLEVSGTEIRNLVRDGQAFRFLVTEAVHEYISGNALYPNRRQTDRVEASPDMEESS
jgi:nicotinate-nucleotide adenylyltransferase